MNYRFFFFFFKNSSDENMYSENAEDGEVGYQYQLQ